MLNGYFYRVTEKQDSESPAGRAWSFRPTWGLSTFSPLTRRARRTGQSANPMFSSVLTYKNDRYKHLQTHIW